MALGVEDGNGEGSVPTTKTNLECITLKQKRMIRFIHSAKRFGYKPFVSQLSNFKI